jgi:hypothetical protein
LDPSVPVAAALLLPDSAAGLIFLAIRGMTAAITIISAVMTLET